jgi:hypothetical protein
MLRREMMMMWEIMRENKKRKRMREGKRVLKTRGIAGMMYKNK